MIAEMTAEELNANCRTYVALKAKDMASAKAALERKYGRVETDEEEYIRIYDAVDAERVVSYLYHERGIAVTEIKTSKIGLEEYYIDLMKEGR